MVANTEKESEVHLMIEDISGDTAIFEYIEGKPKIYHSEQFSVMTNDPTSDKQLEQIKQCQGFGGDEPLPGHISTTRWRTVCDLAEYTTLSLRQAQISSASA
jgi:hypothetical protein